MNETRIIKKYPNRRLYDTAISSYITLEDTRRLVLDGLDIKVIDARSKNDITHGTLLQILLHQEEQQSPIFSNQDLQQMIRCYGTTRQLAASEMLTDGFSRLMEQPAEPLAKPIQAPWHHVERELSIEQGTPTFLEDNARITEN